MIPLHELLSRIRWDPTFGAARFRLAYYDRVKQGLIHIAFEDVHFEPGDHFAFRALDEEGVEHAVPFHRVREVWRDDQLVWHRGQ